MEIAVSVLVSQALMVARLNRVNGDKMGGTYPSWLFPIGEMASVAGPVEEL